MQDPGPEGLLGIEEQEQALESSDLVTSGLCSSLAVQSWIRDFTSLNLHSASVK